MPNHALKLLLRTACCCLLAHPLFAPLCAPGQQPVPQSEPSGRQQEETGATSEPGAEAARAATNGTVQIDLGNPRAALQSFLAAADARDYARAARAIDFEFMGVPADQPTRENLAFKLAEVIRSLPNFDVSLVTDDPEAEAVRVPANGEAMPIEMARNQEGQWRIAVESVAQVDSLYVQATAQATQQLADDVGAGPGEAEVGAAPDDGRQNDTDALSNPRRTMQMFLTAAANNDYRRAAQTMDFSLLPAPPTDAEKANLAWKLKEVIDRMQWVDYARIPSDPAGEPFLFPIAATNQPIVIARGTDGNWRFTRETVARVNDLYAVWRDRPRVYQSTLPIWMRTPVIAGNEGWRIVAVCLSIVLSFVIAQIARWIIRQPAKALKSRRPVTATFFHALQQSITPLILWMGLWLGLHWLVVDDEVRRFLNSMLHVLVVVAVAHILYRLVDVVDVSLREFADRRQSKLDDMLAPFVRRSLRATVVILALVQVASILSDQPPASIIAGLGVASIAIGLAAQDTIKNLFGSVMLLADRPFEVGDRVVVDGHDGPVEAVGFRSTRIRTLAGDVVTVPNGELANRMIQNIGKRPHIRRIINLTITYDTPADKIQRAVQIIKDILADHEGMHPDFPPRVYFNDFNDTSLNVFVIYWYHPADYWAYCDFSQRVNFEILKQFEEEGIEFAYPTQTLYLTVDPKRPFYTTAGTGHPLGGNG